MPLRPVVGQRTLNPRTEVRILEGQRPRRLAERAPSPCGLTKEPLSGGARRVDDGSVETRTAHVACERRHPGWAVGADYRRLPDGTPRLWRVSSPTPARSIDHETLGYLDGVVLSPGTTGWWVGSTYLPHHSGGLLSGDHTLEILDGALRGRCVGIVATELGAEDRLPSSLEPVG
jgi:hypothetical protein